MNLWLELLKLINWVHPGLTSLPDNSFSPSTYEKPGLLKGNYQAGSQRYLTAALNNYLATFGYPPAAQQKLNGGICHGLSIVLSEMYNHGKLSWWQSVLNGIICHSHRLNDETYLQRVADDWNLVEVAGPIPTHGQLLERVTSYLLLANAAPKLIHSMDMLSTLRQSSYLTPSETISDKEFRHEYAGDKEIERIQSTATIAGNFCPHLLERILEEDDLNGNIILLSTITHACTLIYDATNTCFGFYDPDESVIDITWYQSKTALCHKIISSLNGPIAITIASGRPHQTFFKHFEFLQQTHAITNTLYANNALPLISRYAPNQLRNFTNEVELNPREIASWANQLFVQYKEGWNGFLILAKYTPKVLSCLLAQLPTTTESYTSLVHILFDRKGFNYQGTVLLLFYAPSVLVQFVEKYASQNSLETHLNACIKDLSPEEQGVIEKKIPTLKMLIDKTECVLLKKFLHQLVSPQPNTHTATAMFFKPQPSPQTTPLIAPKTEAAIAAGRTLG